MEPSAMDEARVNGISDIRTSIVPVLKHVEDMLANLSEDRHPAGRELALVKTKLQEARMWGGMALSHFNTDFTPTDMPDNPESKSKLAQ